ncbi:uncharacterized protein EDB91DRAFT_1058809 [Suillus paluster]|uniref:uncharacterized protein n=1 Tax=Suillus paluster TaxID=48578 RepID=UPI001B871821|nr:uncharacterized protein EDB91DRAFT_1058809 [Suillus paluster]KAG1731341.1 hypothetical protein EDB91DRAFT_1058809 [Suillus paluster]
MFSLPTLSYTNYSLQIRRLSFTIIHSTTIALPAWHKVCHELNLKERLIPQDVVTCWNSTYNMMKFVLAYKSVIDRVTADKSLKLCKYKLNNEDWGIIKDLVATYKKATLFFYQDSASIATVIPAMDKLDSHLNPHTRNPYHPAIKAAMKLARKKINHYYLMTNLSSLYQIAMGKHPIYFYYHRQLTFT